jgi:diguanylate cyclase (GGDEF)-like protein
MHTILGLYINFYAALFLLVVLVTLFVKRDFYSFSGNIFKYLIIVNIFILILEGIAFSLNEVDNQVYFYINYWFNFLLFIMTPLLGSLWAMYIDFKLYHSNRRIRKRWFYLQPFIIGVVLSILNFFYPVLYSISSSNVYRREPFIFVNMTTLFLLMFYIMYLVMKKRKEVDKSVFYGALLFMIFPALGGVIQMINNEINSMYSMMALGIISAYIALETINSSKDHLTKLFIRAKAVDLINSLIFKKKNFAVVMIDLDDFKEINDNYGHSTGDKVLINYGKLLLEVFKEDSLVSRFGGDEFLIVCKDCSEEKLMDYKQRLKDELLEYHKDFTVKFSYGYSFYDESCVKSNDDILVEADNNMYKDKAINKNYKRRSSDR